MTSIRAEGVAEVLWELKRADKVATLSKIAARAGFSPGANGRTVETALKAVRRDWSHLQWWRAIKDDGLLEGGSEHVEKLQESGYEVEESDDREGAVIIASFEEHLMVWEDPNAAATDEAAAADAEKTDDDEK